MIKTKKKKQLKMKRKIRDVNKKQGGEKLVNRMRLQLKSKVQP